MPRTRSPEGEGVVSLDAARRRREIRRLTDALLENQERVNEVVSAAVDAYRTWEEANPDRSLRPADKMEMVRLGFVGSEGFRRCHEVGRLPLAAMCDFDELRSLPDYEEEYRDRMCPAMERGQCEGIWRALRAPPCKMLALEVSKGVGGAGSEQDVVSALEDIQHRSSPRPYSHRFADARRIVREWQERRRKGRPK